MPQKKARIEAVGRKHTDDAPKYLYSWSYQDRLNELRSINKDSVFHQRFNQELRGGANNGPGLYVTTSLSSSADYCAENNGVLIQIVIPNSIPYISVIDHAIMQELRRGDPAVNAMDINRQHPLIPSILLRTTGDWYCLKTQEAVLFREFNGMGSNPFEIQAALTAVRNKRAHPVLLSQVQKVGAPFANHPWV